MSNGNSAASNKKNATATTGDDLGFSLAKLNGKASTVTLGGVAEAGATVSILDGRGNVIGSTTADRNGEWQFKTGKVSGIQSFGISMTGRDGIVRTTTDTAIVGTMGGEIIQDVSGQDNILSGGQGIDRFVFGNVFGRDIITDFIPGYGTHEVIQFNLNTFSDYAAVMANATQVGNNVVIDAGNGNTLTLVGIQRADLKDVNFAFFGDPLPM